jgi:uncharacterized protein (DUF4415 family)
MPTAQQKQISDDDPDEECFVALGISSMGRILVVVYTTREDRIRIISARKATCQEVAVREQAQMKRQYDFSKARRGPVVPPGKTRTTIRLDNDVIEHFQAMVDRAGGGNYQTLINDALREYIRGARLEAVVRRAVREEIGAIREVWVKTA